jgi:hypothetical protein
MKTLTNYKIKLSDDGKSVSITADVIDQPFSGMLITRVSHGHQNPVNTKYIRRIQSSNEAVFVESRQGKFALSNDFVAAIAAVVEPKTTFAPHFHKNSVPANVSVASETPVTYQWQISDNAYPEASEPHTPPPAAIWTDIVGATDAKLDETKIANGKWIRCVATNATGATITQPARLLAAPTITAQLQAITASVGASANLSIAATGLELVYQWFKNGTLLAKQIGSAISFAKLTPNDAGIYFVVVSNDAGNVKSSPVSIVVNPAPK